MEMLEQRIELRAYYMAENGVPGSANDHWVAAEQIEHLEWLVAGRSENQKVSLKLYQILRDYQIPVRHNFYAHEIAQQLVSVAFSLWRAVFLADTITGTGGRMQDAEKFLLEIVSNNAIGFIQDKKSRNWTFHYYVNNARDRLERLSMCTYPFLIPKLVRISATSSKDWWEYYQSLLSQAVDNFGMALSQHFFGRGPR